MQRHIAELQAQIFLPTPNWHLALDARLRNLYTAELIAEGWGPFELATVYLVE